MNNGNFEQYKNNQEIVIENGIISNFYDVNKFLEIIDFEKLKTLNCNFIYKDTLVKIELVPSGDIVMRLSNYNENIKEYLLNLPQQINILIFENRYINSFLEGYFTNLPVSIKKILFLFDSTFELLNYTGKLNVLFGAKLPFDCIVEILVDSEKYMVSYENNNDDELTLFSETGEKIIVKYIKNNGETFNVYSQNYNVLRIMSGMGGLCYSS
jgi:hypothetical protein